MQRRFGWISKQDAAAGLLLVSSDMVGKGEERKWGIESRERSTWGGSRGPGAVGIYIAVGNFRKPNSTSPSHHVIHTAQGPAYWIVDCLQ
jgi:hypothetical protein